MAGENAKEVISMEFDMADIKPSVLSWIIVGLMAASFIVITKWLVTKYPVPGLTDFFNAV